MSEKNIKSGKEKIKKAEYKSLSERFPNVKLMEHFTGILKKGQHYEMPTDLSDDDKKALIAFSRFLTKRDSDRDLKKSRNLIEQVQKLKKENGRLTEGLSVDSLKTKFNVKSNKKKTNSKDIREGLANKIMRQTKG